MALSGAGFVGRVWRFLAAAMAGDARQVHRRLIVTVGLLSLVLFILTVPVPRSVASTQFASAARLVSRGTGRHQRVQARARSHATRRVLRRTRRPASPRHVPRASATPRLLLATGDASWSAPATIDPGANLLSVACPSATQCTAVDDSGREVTFNPSSPGTLISGPVAIDPFFPGGTPDAASAGILACPSTTQCTAVDINGGVGTFNPRSPGSPVSGEVTSGGNVGVACPSATQCTEVNDGTFTDTEGAGATTFDPASPGIDSAITSEIFPSEPDAPSIDCPTTSQCTATVGSRSDFMVTFNPSSPDPPIASFTGPIGRNPACPTAAQCTTVTSDQEITFNPTSPGTPAPVLIDPAASTDASQGLRSIACPFTTKCVAVDYGGRAFEGNPQTSDAWATQPIDGPNSLTDVACAADGQCVAVDVSGQRSAPASAARSI